MYYIDIQEKDLQALRDGLELIERLFTAAHTDPLRLCLYGITSDPAILDAAKEAIAEEASEEGVTEETIQLVDVAVSIPLSSDIIFALTGSGLKLDKNADFAYLAGEGEGYRELNFGWAGFKPSLNITHFTSLALAEDTSWLDRFAQQHGSKTPAIIGQEISREIPATGTAAPAMTSTPEAPEAPQAPQRKQTSAQPRITDILENWLG